jgi:hypothetical protein
MPTKRQNKGVVMARARWASRYAMLKEVSKYVSDKVLLNRIQSWPTRIIEHLLIHYKKYGQD